jgi:CspA family cold shock protein
VRGIVKFFKADKGWGALVTPELPSDVWVHFSVIERDGFRELEAGDEVDFDVEAAVQDSFRFAPHERGSSRTGPPRLFDASATTSSSQSRTHRRRHSPREHLDPRPDWSSVILQRPSPPLAPSGASSVDGTEERGRGPRRVPGAGCRDA